MEETDTRDAAKIIEHAMCEFNSAMKRRENLSIRIGRRTTQIIRVSMIGMTLFLASGVFLIHTLAEDTSRIAQRIDEMTIYLQYLNNHVVAVAENMHGVKLSVDQVKQSVEDLNQYVKVMPAINVSVGKISDDMLKINHSITSINTNLISLNNNIDIISVDMARMSHQFIGLNNQLGVMGYNVDRMASPMKIFPFP